MCILNDVDNSKNTHENWLRFLNLFLTLSSQVFERKVTLKEIDVPNKEMELSGKVGSGSMNFMTFY